MGTVDVTQRYFNFRHENIFSVCGFLHPVG